ncbi:MAG: hypothetical protein ACI8W8_000251 [Rhodothermales bacterium]|jgi:hypothetical protein
MNQFTDALQAACPSCAATLPAEIGRIPNGWSTAPCPSCGAQLYPAPETISVDLNARMLGRLGTLFLVGYCVSQGWFLLEVIRGNPYPNWSTGFLMIGGIGMAGMILARISGRQQKEYRSLAIANPSEPWFWQPATVDWREIAWPLLLLGVTASTPIVAAWVKGAVSASGRNWSLELLGPLAIVGASVLLLIVVQGATKRSVLVDSPAWIGGSLNGSFACKSAQDTEVEVLLLCHRTGCYVSSPLNCFCKRRTPLGNNGTVVDRTLISADGAGSAGFALDIPEGNPESVGVHSVGWPNQVIWTVVACWGRGLGQNSQSVTVQVFEPNRNQKVQQSVAGDKRQT